MKIAAGFEQSFNIQTDCDAMAQIIVAAELTSYAADNAELLVMPEVLLANADYRSKAVLAQLSQR